MSVNFNDRLLAWGTLAAALLMAVPLAVAAIADRAHVHDALLDLQKEHVSQEQRLENNEGGWASIRADLATVKNDVGWIKDQMKRQPPQTAGR